MQRPEYSASDQRDIAEPRLFHGAADGEQIQSRERAQYADPDKNIGFSAQKQEADYGNQHHIKTRHEARFPGASGELDAPLLEHGGEEQNRPADRGRDQKLFFPRFVRLRPVKNQNDRDQGNRAERKSDAVKGKRAEKRRADTLGDERKAPDHRRQQ